MARWEPSEEAVEALRSETRDRFGDPLADPYARFVLRRQHEREEAILAAAREQVARYRPCMQCLNVAEKTLAAHAKLDAPKVPEAPTLLEAAKAMLRYPAHEHSERWLALEAAVKREERK